jgi:anti-sigma B factor antagonist
MDFEIRIDEHAEGYSLLEVRGEVDLHTAPKVEAAVERAAEGGGAVVVVDMGGIAFMDSTALSTFMRAKDFLEERGVAFRLVSPSKAVERILGVTGFRDYFEIYASRQEAIPGPPA